MNTASTPIEKLAGLDLVITDEESCQTCGAADGSPICAACFETRWTFTPTNSDASASNRR